MAIKEIFGEVNRNDLINLGDRIIVKYYDEEDNNKPNEIKGLLMKATPESIIINGEIEKKEIKIEKILWIKKNG